MWRTCAELSSALDPKSDALKTRTYVLLMVLFTGLAIALLSWLFTQEPSPRMSILTEGMMHAESPSEWIKSRNRIEGPTVAPLSPNKAEQVFPEASRQAKHPKLKLGKLTFVIHDLHGDPVSDALITLRSDLGEKTSITQSDGEAAFENLVASRYFYWLKTDERPELTTAKPLELSAGEVKVLELQLGDYDYTIAGRVINQDGNPVAGIEVTSRLSRMQTEANTLVPRLQATQRVRSDTDGWFEITGLGEGEHEFRTIANDRYSSVKIIVQAGINTVVLPVVERRELRVVGQITSSDGNPLAGVKVLNIWGPSRQTHSDEQGRYELAFADAGPNSRHRFRFVLNDYQPKHLDLIKTALLDADTVRLDAVLEPVGQTEQVLGYVMDEQGMPVSGEWVHLFSRLLKYHYRAISDPNGKVVFPEVLINSDYRLWVLPKGQYKTYMQNSINLVTDPLPFEVVLESVSVGTLKGHMVDVAGNPVPQFSLWLRNADVQGESRTVIGDAYGHFEVDKVPEGSLTMETRSTPHFRISGIELDAFSEEYFELVLDWGDAFLEGQVVDVNGQPLAGAQVNLNWRFGEKSLRSSSFRKTITDSTGVFMFSQLGVGSRHLRVSAAGHRPIQQVLQPDGERVVVRLELLEK